MADIYVMEQVNLFLGDENPDESLHLALQSMTLPTLEYATSTHMGGGAVMEVEWNMGVLKALKPTFKLVGFAHNAYRAFGIGSNLPRTYTARGGLRRKSDGKLFKAVATFKGTISKLAAESFEAGKALGHDHEFADLTRYKMVVDNETWTNVDFFSGKRVNFGVDEFGEMRAALGLT